MIEACKVHGRLDLLDNPSMIEPFEEVNGTASSQGPPIDPAKETETEKWERLRREQEKPRPK